jgi:hypothetical protein
MASTIPGTVRPVAFDSFTFRHISSEEFAIGDECFIIAYQLYRYLPGDTRRKGIILGASVFSSLLWNMIILEDKFFSRTLGGSFKWTKNQESSAMCRIENGGVTR